MQNQANSKSGNFTGNMGGARDILLRVEQECRSEFPENSETPVWWLVGILTNAGPEWGQRLMVLTELKLQETLPAWITWSGRDGVTIRMEWKAFGALEAKRKGGGYVSICSPDTSARNGAVTFAHAAGVISLPQRLEPSSVLLSRMLGFKPPEPPLSALHLREKMGVAS